MFNNEKEFKDQVKLYKSYVSIKKDMDDIHRLIEDIKINISTVYNCVIDPQTKKDLDEYKEYLNKIKDEITIRDDRIAILHAAPSVLKVHYEDDTGRPYWPDLKSALSSYLGRYIFDDVKIRVLEQSEAGTEFKVMITDKDKNTETIWIGVAALDQLLKDYKSRYGS